MFALRCGGAIAGLTLFAVIGVSQSAQGAGCLYPDKSKGTPPSYSCLKPTEHELVELRKFRAEITIAALRCQQKQAYNRVVSRHQNELVRSDKALGAVFRRLYGASGARELNRYVTHLTNRASMRSIGVRDYCGAMSRVFAEALNVPLRAFMAFVDGNPIARAEKRSSTKPSLAVQATPASTAK